MDTAAVLVIISFIGLLVIFFRPQPPGKYFRARRPRYANGHRASYRRHENDGGSGGINQDKKENVARGFWLVLLIFLIGSVITLLFFGGIVP